MRRLLQLRLEGEPGRRGIHNADRIVPDWQHRARGEFVPSVRPDYANGRVRDIAGWRIGWIEKDRGLTFRRCRGRRSRLLLLLVARDAYVTIGLGLLCVAAMTIAGAAIFGIPRQADSPFGIPVAWRA